MKNDTTFIRMRSGDHLGDAKMLEKRHLAPSNLNFLLLAIVCLFVLLNLRDFPGRT